MFDDTILYGMGVENPVYRSHKHTYRFTRFSAAPHATILLFRNHALMRMQHLRT